MDRENYYKKLAEISLDLPIDRNDFLTKRFGAPMKKMTYRDTCIDYVKKTVPCVGYRDYIVSELQKLEQIEHIINEYNNGNDMEYEYLSKIKEVLENE